MSKTLEKHLTMVFSLVAVSLMGWVGLSVSKTNEGVATIMATQISILREVDQIEEDLDKKVDKEMLTARERETTRVWEHIFELKKLYSASDARIDELRMAIERNSARETQKEK